MKCFVDILIFGVWRTQTDYFCDVCELVTHPLTAADTYIFLFPLAEINLERWHRELLAHPSLIVYSFRNHCRIFGVVPAKVRGEDS